MRRTIYTIELEQYQDLMTLQESADEWELLFPRNVETMRDCSSYGMSPEQILIMREEEEMTSVANLVSDAAETASDDVNDQDSDGLCEEACALNQTKPEANYE